ncbi:MAG: hypothetical protein KME08_15710 [Aphanothece sp. CMT-3BRIN-NPC111]|jgi:hypothetical protein|nr:hypothetical protein [Aphanothece sp. CMT-3BRIN-NPC111]
MLNKVSITICFSSMVVLLSQALLISPAFSQSSQQNSNSNSSIGNNSDANVILQNSNQNNAQNRTDIDFNNPLNTPVNTENDFGFNLSVGVNTQDTVDTTVYLGFIFQPGRTDSHNARMARLRAETELLESQKQVNQVQLQLLQKQIAEAEVRLQRLQQNPESMPPRSSGSINEFKIQQTPPIPISEEN